MRKGQWEVAVAVLTGVASISEDILNSGDDSAGELGAIVSACFENGMNCALMRHCRKILKLKFLNSRFPASLKRI